MRLLIIIFHILACIRLYSEVESTFPSIKESQSVDNLTVLESEHKEPVRIEDVLVYYRGPHFYGGERHSSDNFNKIKEGLSLNEIVSLLGPGSQNTLEGIGFISWRCEDGRILQMWPTGRLNDDAKYHIVLHGESQRTKEVKQLAESLISSLEILDQKVSVVLAEDTYQAKAGEARTYAVGQTFQKTTPLPRIDFSITKIEEDLVHCRYFYQARHEGLLRYSESGNIKLQNN